MILFDMMVQKTEMTELVMMILYIIPKFTKNNTICNNWHNIQFANAIQALANCTFIESDSPTRTPAECKTTIFCASDHKSILYGNRVLRPERKVRFLVRIMLSEVIILSVWIWTILSPVIFILLLQKIYFLWYLEKFKEKEEKER